MPTPAHNNDAVDPHRRRVLKAAAWSLPVIAVAVAVPVSSASETPPVITPETGLLITQWKGDHHYGSEEDDQDQRSYDFPITITDASGNPLPGVLVTVVASGANGDGDLLSVHRHPAPDSDPESSPRRTATATTTADGVALFAVNTQNLSSGERPAIAFLTISATVNGVATTVTVTVTMTQSD